MHACMPFGLAPRLGEPPRLFGGGTGVVFDGVVARWSRVQGLGFRFQGLGFRGTGTAPVLSARPLFLDAELFGVAVSDGGGDPAKCPQIWAPKPWTVLSSETLKSLPF